MIRGALRVMDYSQFLSAAICAAKDAGKLVTEGFKREDKRITFKSTTDLVTETDKKCEEIIINSLKSQFPSHNFLGEEGAADGKLKEELTSLPTWIIDPIDGTTNFVHGYPCVAVSIGLAINKVVVVGVVFNPISNELFYALKGGGAFLNENQIRTSSRGSLGESLVAIGFPYDRDDIVLEKHCKRIFHIAKNCRSICSDGSAALDMCSVAMGRIAGSIIVKEAGGYVVDPDKIEWEENDNFESELNICEHKVLAVGCKDVIPKFTSLLHK